MTLRWKLHACIYTQCRQSDSPTSGEKCKLAWPRQRIPTVKESVGLLRLDGKRVVELTQITWLAECRQIHDLTCHSIRYHIWVIYTGHVNNLWSRCRRRSKTTRVEIPVIGSHFHSAGFWRARLEDSNNSKGFLAIGLVLAWTELLNFTCSTENCWTLISHNFFGCILLLTNPAP